MVFEVPIYDALPGSGSNFSQAKCLFMGTLPVYGCFFSIFFFTKLPIKSNFWLNKTQ